MPVLKRFLTALAVAWASALVGAAAEQKYIVVLKDGISTRSVDAHIAQAHGIHARSVGRRELHLPGIEDTYSMGDFQGYSGTFDNDTIAEIQHLPEVDAVVPDQPGRELVLVTQENADHGLASLSSRGPGASSFRYDDAAGRGTFAYVVDSGIQSSHPDFGGRVTQGYSLNGKFNDPRPHGTMVAGVLASATYGVAKKAEIIDVRVSHSLESLSHASILRGLDWAVGDIIKRGRVGKAVINISLDGGTAAIATSVPPLNRAVEAAFQLGVLVVTAAGNDGSERVDQVTPASAPNAVTVGAIDEAWRFSSGSNHGPMIDILAPGEDVLTVWSQTGEAVRGTGTSLAAAYVAGVALCLTAPEKPRSVQALVARIKSLGTTGKVGGVPDSTVNLVAYNGVPAVVDAPVVLPPGRKLPIGGTL